MAKRKLTAEEEKAYRRAAKAMRQLVKAQGEADRQHRQAKADRKVARAKGAHHG